MRRLRASLPAARPDLRPALLSIVALMFLLLPFVLMTTSSDKLAGLGLALSGEGAATPNPGVVERVEVILDGDEIVLRTSIRATDVTADAGDAIVAETRLAPLDGLPDLQALQGRLRDLRRLDPHQRRASVLPTDDTPTARVVALVDAVRGDADGALFDQVILGARGETP
ncbi:MAG: hypothetical protein QGH45_05725 [Myxococcota bacterium]|jgi:hypothetical protein|nr:hypothetical protein [Myxococcota bacterium]